MEISNVDISVVLDDRGGQAGQLAQPVALSLRITVSTNRTSTGVHPSILTEGDDSPSQEVHTPTATPDSRVPDQSTEPEPPLPTTDNLPVQGSTTVPRDQGQICLVKEAQDGIDRADELEKSIDGSDTWEGVVGRIKWLMDTLSPVAGVRVKFVLTFHQLT